jgi:amino acid transporter
VIGVILMGLIIDLGGVKGFQRIGFRYWRDPGPFVEYIATGAWGRFLGFWAVLINAVFSFSGVESIAMAAAETRNPRRAIPKACKRVFVRVALFYVLAVLIVGMIVPSNNEELGNDSGTAATSPFVLVAKLAGIKGVPHIINAVVITSAFSSGNQALLAGTRVLYSLALKGQAPRFFLKTTSWGVPFYCVGLYILMSFLSFMSMSSGALTVFYWFMNLVGCGVLISWSSVLFIHIRMRRAFRVQGIDPRRLPWYNRWTPVTSSVALFFTIVLLLTNGFSVFTKGNWSAEGFITSYLDIGLVAAAFLLWKFIKRTKWIHLRDVPLEEILLNIEKNPEDDSDVPKGWVRWISWLWD